MAILPKIKLKAIVSFPANVYGGTGIDVARTNGNFTINLDYSEFPTTGTMPPNTNALVWDPVTDTYYLVPPSSVGGISDAPSDSKMYGRINHAWVDAWASPVLTGNPTAPTPAPGDNDTSIATTAFVTAALTGSVAGVTSIGSKSGVVTLNGGSMATNELPAPRYDVAQTLTAGQQKQARANVAVNDGNVIINGDFRVNQVGYVSGAALAVGVYGHDQWKAGASGGDYSFTQLKSSTQITIASGKSLIQPIEDVNVSGGSYVLSWAGTAQARAGVNTLTPSGSYAVSPLLISGQAAGTVMSVEFNAGTLGTVKLESGSISTPFIMRPYDQELVTCQRYYEKSYPYADAPGTAYSNWQGGQAIVAPVWVATNFFGSTIYYKVSKRTAATIRFYAPYTGANNFATLQAGNGNIPLANNTAGGEHHVNYIVNNSATPASSNIGLHFTADARL